MHSAHKPRFCFVAFSPMNVLAIYNGNHQRALEIMDQVNRHSLQIFNRARKKT